MKPRAAEEPHLGDGHRGGLAGQGTPKRDSDTGDGAHRDKSQSPESALPRPRAVPPMGVFVETGFLPATFANPTRDADRRQVTSPDGAFAEDAEGTCPPLAHDMACVPGPWRDRASQKDSRAQPKLG